jgi:cell division protein FtsQ
MMAESKIKRGEGARKRPTVTKKPRKPAPKQPSLWSKLIAAVPIRQATLDRIATAGMVILLGGGLIAGATFAGVPQYIGTATAKAIGRAGFEVKRVEVTGINRMERLTVYAIALDQHSMAMPLVDLDKVRTQLLAYGWIEDARVSRRLPDTLVVDIIERKPAAIWQHNQKLSLIDAKGVILDKLKPNEPTPSLPLLIGADANQQAVAFNQLLGRAPALTNMIASATWVGNRRWDIGFQTGETLALPEGEENAGRSLLRFARVEGVQHLLGGRYIWFDMRTAGKMTARFRSKQKSIDKPDEDGPPIQSADTAKKKDSKHGPA